MVVISIADLGAPEHGARFSGVTGDVPRALAEATGLISRGRAGHARGRRVIVVS